jgi:hypothetical protein
MAGPVVRQDPGLAIFPSRVKALGMLGFCLGVVVLGIQHVQAAHAVDVLSVAGFLLFGLGGLFALIPLITPWPLLRVTDVGIVYSTWMQPWAHPLLKPVHVPWHEVQAIRLRRASSRLVGKYDLDVNLSGPYSEVSFQNWQVPRSADDTLRRIAQRYREQIEHNTVLITGVE